ncbi:HNH endonuclease family protein (plasmid) [Streptomyces sp. NBC_00708]
MTLRRLSFLSAALLATTALTACTAENTKAGDSKPATTESGSTNPSGAPGGAPDGAGLPLAEAIKKIPVAAEKRTGYERDSFKHWVDEDGDGCSTRQEVLLAEAVKAPEQGARCALTGGSWRSYYDEVEVTDARKLDIDHMVPLAEAFDSGAYGWTPERREAYANDLSAERSLVAVTAKTNRSKADKDPAAWMPPSKDAACTYLVDWTATKLRWGLAADEAEQKALLERAEPCTDSVVQYETAP